MRKRADGRRAGFTIIELLGVLIVLGLIATVVTVNWQGILPRSELNSSVRALAAVLQATRSDAIARSAEFLIEYDLDEDRYRVVTPFRLGGGFAVDEEERLAFEWTKLPKSVHFEKVTIDGEEVESGHAFVRFDALGGASAHTIVLAQPSFDAHYTIEVQALTGLIDFYEGVYARPQAVESDFE